MNVQSQIKIIEEDVLPLIKKIFDNDPHDKPYSDGGNIVLRFRSILPDDPSKPIEIKSYDIKLKFTSNFIDDNLEDKSNSKYKIIMKRIPDYIKQQYEEFQRANDKKQFEIIISNSTLNILPS